MHIELLIKKRGSLTVAALTMTALVLAAFHGIAAAQSGQQTINVTNGGTLTYTVFSTLSPCGIKLVPPSDYERNAYSNFVYTSVAGAVTDLTGSLTSLQNTSTSLGVCATVTSGSVQLDGGGYLITFTAGSNSTVGSAVLNTPVGYLNPKYVIMGVTYAPPGPSSFVQYTTTTFLSTTSSIMDSSTTAKSWSAAISQSFSAVPLIASGKITATYDGSYTQASSSSSSVTLSAQSVNQTETHGTPNAFSPVNHDYDYIWLWLNPVVILTANPSSSTLTWDGYAVDTADQNVDVMDIWPVQVGYLNGDFGTLDPEDAQVLSRSWAVGYQTWPSGASPGLTQADFNQILLADPFTNSSYTVNVPAGSDTTADGRFTLSGGSTGSSTTLDYKQADPGESAITQTYNNTYTNTSTQGSTATSTTTQGFGIEVSLQGGAFFAALSADLKASQTMTWVHQTSTALTNTSATGDMLSITGPPCATAAFPCVPAYTGIPEFDVYQDNIYGTFMFNGVN